ncbi:MAG: hypothetical protein HY824_11640 [Acidobacteria bacterium]|nr:hypothetical protein [Acidobacteriota bacterium]
MVPRWIIGLAVVAVSGMASAQTTQGPGAEQVRARQKIFMMEGVLERAVQLGVENLRTRIRAIMPDDALLQGSAPQVRGFRLDGYGVFFDVEVPSLRRSLAWSLRTMNESGLALARDLAAMRAFVQAISDPRARAEFDRILQRVQRQVTPVPGPERVAAQAGPTVAAQSLPPAPAPSADPAAVAQADAALADPSETYTAEVRAALIDAMIENSGALVIGADEWLTVAARDNAPVDSLISGDQGAMTLVIRVKGSDLTAFRAGRLTLEQARTRVQVGQF